MTVDPAEEREELKQALELYQEQWLADLPNEKELEQITFSSSFEKRMKKMAFRQKQKARCLHFDSCVYRSCRYLFQRQGFCKSRY